MNTDPEQFIRELFANASPEIKATLEDVVKTAMTQMRAEQPVVMATPTETMTLEIEKLELSALPPMSAAVSSDGNTAYFSDDIDDESATLRSRVDMAPWKDWLESHGLALGVFSTLPAIIQVMPDRHSILLTMLALQPGTCSRCTVYDVAQVVLESPPAPFPPGYDQNMAEKSCSATNAYAAMEKVVQALLDTPLPRSAWEEQL